MKRNRRPVLLLLCAAAAAALVVAVLTIVPARFWPWAAPEPTRSVAQGQPVPPLADKPLARVAVAGDTGTGTQSEYATAEQMAVQAGSTPYDALLLLGDLIYEDGDVQLVDQVVTEPFAPVLDNGAELLAVLGNHDYADGQQQQILTALGRDNPWYEENVGPLRVLVLDSNQVDDAAQTEWLRQALGKRQPAGTWTVAAMHHPAYSAGAHGSDLDVRTFWGPLFAAADVPLVLAGHDHDYQRSTPQDGVTYVVSGAGAKLRPTGPEDFTAVSTSTLHYLDLLVYDDRLVGRAIDQAGRSIDTFTLSR